MQIVIDIPDKEFGIDINNKFQDFFSRLKVEIKEHLITNTSLVCGAYELETIGMFLNAFKNGTPLPKGRGRLIYADDIALIDEQFYIPSDYYVAESAINDAPTIIEAESESKRYMELAKSYVQGLHAGLKESEE